MHNLTRMRYEYSFRLFIAAVLLFLCFPANSVGSTSIQTGSQTPFQAELEAQRQRLSASDPEERRDALMRLGSMRRAEASRAALPGLSDASPLVRAVAAKAILSIGPDESAAALLPLASDKDEFVRREVAYALGLSKSRNAIDTLSKLLLNDKEDGVRAAAAVALGDIGDERAVVALAGVLAPQLGQAQKKKEKNVFVLRSAAKSLGQIRSRAGVPALVSALSNEKLEEDVRREAAYSLGLIGDVSAVPALRAAANSGDPYLSQVSVQSLKKIAP